MGSKIPTRMEKCKGAMLGTAIGDALGWPNERRSKNGTKIEERDSLIEWTRAYRKPFYYNEIISPGEYSDDTQMTLSVARSIIFGDWEYFFMEKELPFWLQYERGGGRALLRAARFIRDKRMPIWKSGRTREYFLAGGNGAAMRILPHVIAHASYSDITALMVDVIKDTLITHGHPRAFLGATCYAFALMYLLKKDTVLEYGELVSAVMEGCQYWGGFPPNNFFEEWISKATYCAGFNYADEWEKTRVRMLCQFAYIQESLKRGLLVDETKVLAKLGCFDQANGAGDVAILAAVYLASKYATNPVLGIKVPAFLAKADTDTVASITGGLLGMLSGSNWIPPEWEFVQDYQCLIEMAELLLAADKKMATKLKLEESEFQNYIWENSPVGKKRLMETKQIHKDRNGAVAIEKWRTMLGQTIYIKEFQISDDVLSTAPNPSYIQKTMQQESAVRDVRNSEHEISFSKAAEDMSTAFTGGSGKRKLVMDADDIRVLMEDPSVNERITLGKFLKIIQAFIKDEEPVPIIAQRFKVNEKMINSIMNYIKNEGVIIPRETDAKMKGRYRARCKNS